MKLRIHRNSLRIRLVQSEVAQLAQGLPLEQTTEFGPDARLITRVEPTPAVVELSATFSNSMVSVHIPLHQAIIWATGDDVGLESLQSVDAERSLKILIEKDFQCLHHVAEGTGDAYPNPRHGVEFASQS